jgi:hypothetical protein
MESIANLVIAACDLAEAEGRAAHRGVIRLLVRAGAVIGAAVFALVGVLLIAWGIYEAIALAIGGNWGHVWAALICGAILLAAAAGAFLYGRIPPKRPQQAKVIKDPYVGNARTTDEVGTTARPRTQEGNGHGTLHPVGA